MFHVNKIFSNPIDFSAKKKFVSLLQLESQPFVFCEIAWGHLMRVFRVKGNEVVSLLEPDSSLPVVKLTHSENKGEATKNRGKHFWQLVLPFPWNSLSPDQLPLGSRLEFSCPKFESDWNKVVSHFKELQEQVGRSEVACLSFSEDPSEGILVLRYVRGQVIESSFHAPSLEKQLVEKSVGTSVSYTHIKKIKTMKPLGFSPAQAALEEAIQSTQFYSPYRLETHDALRFEL